MWYKLYKSCENRARDTPLRGVCIPLFDQISVEISVLGVLYPYRCTDGVKFGTIHSSMPNFTPSVQRVKTSKPQPQNRPLSNLNTVALRARSVAGNYGRPM